MIVRPNYWYKGYAQLLSGLPTCFEGGIRAASPEAAMAFVEQLSESWSIATLRTVMIYELSNGAVAEHPILIQQKDAAVTPPSPLALPAPQPSESISYVYEKATWLTPFYQPPKFNTVNFKET